jgi:hypothetical protein
MSVVVPHELELAVVGLEDGSKVLLYEVPILDLFLTDLCGGTETRVGEWFTKGAASKGAYSPRAHWPLGNHKCGPACTIWVSAAHNRTLLKRSHLFDQLDGEDKVTDRQPNQLEHAWGVSDNKNNNNN